MRISWTQGKDADAKKEIRQSYVAAVILRKRLMELLEKKIKDSWKASIDTDGYDCPNWALKQADARGYERALREVQHLISSEK